MKSDSQKRFERWVINSCCCSLEKADATETFYTSIKTRMLWRAWLGCEKDMEAENQKLREQLDAANYVIQTLNRVIAGDME